MSLIRTIHLSKCKTVVLDYEVPLDVTQDDLLISKSLILSAKTPTKLIFIGNIYRDNIYKVIFMGIRI